MKKVFLPVSLALLAGLTVSCSTTEYKNMPAMKPNKWLPSCERMAVWTAIRQMLLFHSTVISPLSVQS